MSKKATPTRDIISRSTVKHSNASGTYYALLIGISTYKYQQDLEHPVQDAQHLQQVLFKHYSFPEEQVFLLENPTRTEFTSFLCRTWTLGRRSK